MKKLKAAAWLSWLQNHGAEWVNISSAGGCIYNGKISEIPAGLLSCYKVADCGIVRQAGKPVGCMFVITKGGYRAVCSQ